jgi:imidazolonepropionase-like amidohydrolase
MDPAYLARPKQPGVRAGLFWIVACIPAILHGQPLLLTNAKLVDVDTREISKEHLQIEGGSITARFAAVPEQYAGEIIDLEGKWVMPGLIDLHVHTSGDQAPGGVFEELDNEFTLRRYLYAGVSAVLNLFGDEDSLVAVREHQRSQPERDSGSDLFASLSCLTATNGHCTQFGTPTRTMDSPEEARRQINELAEKKPDVLKIVYSIYPAVPTIDKATLVAAIATGKALGIKTVVHIDSVEDMRDVIAAGPDAITHLPDLEPLPSILAAEMARKGIAIIPTLAVHTEIVDFVQDPSILNTPLAVKLASTAIRDGYKQEYTTERVARMRAFNAMYYEDIRILHQAGVTILAGSDAGNMGTIHGYSLHREMIKLVEAGLSPWEALAAATIDAADFLGLNYGLREGDAASLLILDASPVEDIANTQLINRVIHHGRLVYRDNLL